MRKSDPVRTGFKPPREVDWLNAQCGRNQCALNAHRMRIRCPVWTDGAKGILGCSSETCNEAVRGDMDLNTLQSCGDRATLKLWYKLATLPEDRYPKQLFNQEWNIKTHRGRQRKVWSRMVDDLFKYLDIDKEKAW